MKYCWGEYSFTDATWPTEMNYVFPGPTAKHCCCSLSAEFNLATYSLPVIFIKVRKFTKTKDS